MESGADPEVLIIGAGPTGLALAIWLARLAVRVRIVDRDSGPGLTSRAVAVQARTLELYQQVDLANTVVAAGRQVAAANLWVAGRRAARVPLGELGAGLSPYPYALVYPQDEHERLLIDRLQSASVRVERKTELIGFEERGGRVEAQLKRPDGTNEVCTARYLAGCDGAHSTVRRTLNVGFTGAAYEHLFYVADINGGGAALDGEIHIAFGRNDFVAVFPFSEAGRARLIGTVSESAASENLSWESIGAHAIEQLGIRVDKVNWFSTYHVHHRVAERFRRGNAFLIGDAAHIHSPVGGQGMNTGINDAINLSWKLAAVLRGRANESILDTYEPERMAFARRLVATTDRAFTGVTSSRFLARTTRLRLAPLVLPALFRIMPVRRLAFRTVSQIGVNYRSSSLSVGNVGGVRGGDRLPWVADAAGPGADNFAPLRALDWQVHVYGAGSPALREACAMRQLALHEFPWITQAAHAGLHQNALYLIRPDGYVGLADPVARLDALTSYLDARAITPHRA